MKIGEKIKNAREDKDLSQSDIAKLIPMNQSNYSKIERDIQEPSMKQLKRICEILSLDPRYLLGLGDYRTITSSDINLLSEVKKIIEKYKI